MACLPRSPARGGTGRRAAAVQLGPVSGGSPLHRPDLLAGRTPRTINMSTIGDDLLREASPTFGPKVEAVVVYNSNPWPWRPIQARWCRALRAKTCSPWCWSTFTRHGRLRRLILPATTQLEHWDVHLAATATPMCCSTPAIAPQGQARSNARSSATWRRAWVCRRA